MTYLKNTKLQNYIHNVDTNFTSQAITGYGSKSNATAFDGTEVTYTPATNASKVVYEISFQTAWNPDVNHSICSFRLEYEDPNTSVWTDIPGTQGFIGTVAIYADSEWSTYTFRCILDTWTGSRKIRANAPAWSVGTQYTLGRSYNANNSTGVGSCPHVSIYSIM